MSFRLKTILGIAVIEAVLLLILIVSSLGYLRDSYEEELQKRAQTTAKLFATTTQDAVLATDLASLQSFVDEVLTNPDIVYARVRGNDGVLAQGGDPSSLERPFQADQGFPEHDPVFDAYADIIVAGVPFGRVEIGLAVEGVHSVLAEARRHTLGIAGAELILVALFSFTLGTYLTRELKTLRAATRHVSRGDLEYRIAVRGQDELAQTAAAFNAMAGSLQEAFHARDRAREDLDALNRELEARVHSRTEELTVLNEQLEHQALHDSLTKVPNRTLFNDRLEQQLARSRRDRGEFALAVIDLDRFKEINDVRGHQAGDLVLQEVARRLREEMRQSDTVARMGGDEFALLLPDIECVERLKECAERLMRLVTRPVDAGDELLEVGVSVGIAVFPHHGADAQTLIRRADAAMYQAKASRTGYCVYRKELDQFGHDRHALQGELRQAIESGQLVLHYQPKVDLSFGITTGVEALVRWQHPRQGLLYPDKFVALAERSGLIGPMTVAVLRAALAQCRAWRDAGLHLTVAVNTSAQNLMDEEFPDLVAKLLAESGAEPQWLELEITETAVMTNPRLAVQTVRALSAMGVSMSIDDFGTGYSSMAYLKKLLVAKIKIDRSFVKEVTVNENDAVIVRSTIELGHNLGLLVIAEGVEDESTWNLLKDLGCDAAQGYFMSKPLAAHALEVWMDNTPWPPLRHAEAAPGSRAGT